MAMRKPRFLKPEDHLRIDDQPRSPFIRALGQAAPVLPWPHGCEKAQVEPVLSRADIRTKRFPGHTGAEEERFTATLESATASPISLLRALTSALEKSQEMQAAPRPGEPMILEIRLVAGS
jgi:hypothetical protein